MAKKVNKKTVNTQAQDATLEEVTTNNFENVSGETETYYNNMVKEVEDEAKEALQNIMDNISNSNTDEIEHFMEEITDMANTFTQEKENKEVFLSNFDNDFETKSENELRQTLEGEINRIDGLISKISEENKIPMTTSYWNGMQFDF